MVRVIMMDEYYDEGPSFDFDTRDEAEDFIKMVWFRIVDEDELW